MSSIRLVMMCAVVFSLPCFAEVPRVIVLPVTGTDAALRELGQSLSEQMLTELDRSGQMRAIGPSDLESVIGLERQKQLLGCSVKSESCMTEISAALGAEYVLSATLGRIGKTVRIDVKILRSSTAKVVFRAGRSIKNESDLFEVVSALTKEILAEKMFPVVPVAVAPEPVAVVKPVVVEDAPMEVAAPVVVEQKRSVGPWVTIGVGAAALIVGAVFSISAGSAWGSLNDSSWRAKNSFETQTVTGQGYRRDVVIGPVLVGVGAVAIVGGIVWRLLDHPAPPVTVGFVPGSNAFVIQGAL